MSKFHAIQIDVSKRDPIKKEFVKVGETTVYTPLLRDILPFVTSEVQKDKDGKDVSDSDSVPMYVSEEANWIQGAMIAAVKAAARNKLVKETANLRDGAKIAEDWADLTAEVTRDGSGLALAREFKATFADWIAKQGLSEAATSTLTTLVSNKAALQLQNEGTKNKVKIRLEAFAEQAEAAVMEKLMRPLQAALDSCVATDDPLADL